MNNTLFRNFDLEFFTKQVLHIQPYRLDTVALQKLPNWDNVNALLESGLLDYPRIRISSVDAKYSRGYCGFLRYSSNPRGARSATIIPDLLYRALDDGCTIIIDGCQDYFPSVLALTNEIEHSLRCQSWANIYISAQSGTSFGCHFDDHDIISVQLSGTKNWHIYKPTYISPNRGDKSFYLNPPTSAPDLLENLSPGSSLYLPSGYWHDVQTISAYSLHMTLGLDFPRKLDIVRAITSKLGLIENFRGDINFSPNSPELYSFRENLIAAIRDLDFRECMKDAIEVHRKRRPTFNLPDHQIRRES
ncbi:cupin domain-containing protein [Burkholderia anthina]|uniref:cupin domain-containing protein n=1 Tax=Burkholderia anthina TaxID=179879 RepID=UPI001CF4AD68|nr:cupin domain-containing protein [Burkholderia anthina]MCA8090567.1 cupin domain-containing protein [Burkholderia anthina]